jgi:hypothetical protein
LHPTSFYSSFPLPGHPWVSLLPSYNEHLVRDVGELSPALTVVLAAAAVIGQWLLSAVAVVAIAMYAVPHAIFHFLHLEGFPTSDAIAQTIGIALHLLVIAVVAWLLWRERPAHSPTLGRRGLAAQRDRAVGRSAGRQAPAFSQHA